MTQIPSGAVGTVAGVMIFTIISLLAGSLVIWLTWVHHERTSYVACIAWLATVGTICSLAQQIHDSIHWRDVQQARFDFTQANPHDRELALHNGVVGTDRVLFFIQYYTYNANTLLFMFWSWALVQSVYNLNSRRNLKRPLLIINRMGKTFSFLFPVLTISALQTPSVQAHIGGFMLLADLPLMISLAFGGIAILAILIRYVQSRRRLQSFNVTYGQSSSSENENKPVDVSRRASQSASNNRNGGIYDRWLMTRFTIAFLVTGIFQVTTVLFQVIAVRNTTKDIKTKEVDFSAERAIITFLLVIPGVSPSLLMFIVFGTTKPFLKYLRAHWSPRRAQHIRIYDGTSFTRRPSDTGSDSSLEKGIAKAPMVTSVVRVERSPSPAQDTNVSISTMKPLPEPPTISVVTKDLGLGYTWKIGQDSDLDLPARVKTKSGVGRNFGEHDEWGDIPIQIQSRVSILDWRS